MDGGDAMTVAMILELPGVPASQHAIARGLLGAALQLGDSVHIVPPAKPAAAPLVADAADGDPTWEDAEWQ
jgi:hypothetical protein